MNKDTDNALPILFAFHGLIDKTHLHVFPFVEIQCNIFELLKPTKPLHKANIRQPIFSWEIYLLENILHSCTKFMCILCVLHNTHVHTFIMCIAMYVNVCRMQFQMSRFDIHPNVWLGWRNNSSLEWYVRYWFYTIVFFCKYCPFM